jgi:hypothetical protein
MVRCQALFVTLVLLCGSAVASAQDAGAGKLEAGFFPGGATFYRGGDDNVEVDFNTYNFGGYVSWYLNRLLAVEGEGSYGIGIAQDVTVRNRFFEHIHVPNTLSANANIVVFPAGADRLLAPYVTGGVGMLSLRTRGAATTTLGMPDPETFVASNFGGGVKLLRGGSGLGSWGIRADYRLLSVGSRDDAAPFFASTKRRMGHRIYFGIQYTVAR